MAHTTRQSRRPLTWWSAALPALIAALLSAYIGHAIATRTVSADFTPTPAPGTSPAPLEPACP